MPASNQSRSHKRGKRREYQSLLDSAQEGEIGRSRPTESRLNVLQLLQKKEKPRRFGRGSL
jgi:hypothetical protein